MDGFGIATSFLLGVLGGRVIVEDGWMLIRQAEFRQSGGGQMGRMEIEWSSMFLTIHNE